MISKENGERKDAGLSRTACNFVVLRLLMMKWLYVDFVKDNLIQIVYMILNVA